MQNVASQLDLAPVLAALKAALLADRGTLVLHEPCFAGNEWDYVKDTLDTGWVSSAGPYVNRFEAELCEFTGAQHAVATTSGTAALHICLKLAGVEAGDEVLVPALTFVATANAVAYCCAVPHFVDSSEVTLGLDPVRLASYLQETTILRGRDCFNRKTGARIRAVVPMHTFGHPVDLDPLVGVSERFGLVLVEDAAESLGSYYKGRHTGSFSKLAALSFNGNKIVTTGGGGAILTNDSSLALLAKHLTTTAKLPHPWAFVHDQIGYNYRLPNINAALGCAQLEQLPGFLKKKRQLAAKYARVFRDVAGVRFFTESSFATSNYWLNVLLLDEPFASQRDDLLAAAHQAGFLSRPAWTPLHKLPMYCTCPRMDLSVTEQLERRLINLPSSPSLVADE